MDMEELFKLSPEKLSEICIVAEFDEKEQLIIDERNCIHEGNITFLKRPILIRYGVLQTSIFNKTAIVKESEDCAFLYVFALAETAKYRETLRDYYELNHCNQYDCFALNGYYPGWERDEDFHLMEVKNEGLYL